MKEADGFGKMKMKDNKEISQEELDKDLSEQEELDQKIKKIKKKSSLGKKVLTFFVILIALLCLLLGGLVIAADIYLDNMLDLISFEIPQESEWEWTFDPLSFAGDEDFLSAETSVELSSAPTPSQEPSFAPIEDLFDGENISAEYEDEVLNVLLIGADNAASLSDTMVLLSVNPVKERIVLTSFLRDSYVEIPGYGYSKLNAAHAYGGSKLLIETLEYNFEIDIDNYARVNFGSFKDAVDALGGVDLVVNQDNHNYFYNWSGIWGLSKAEATDGTHTVHLDGEDALAYVRNRNYWNGDFTRTLHQRDFVSQFINNCKGSSLEELQSMLQSVLKHVATDMPKDDLKSNLYNALTYLTYNMTDAHVPCDGSWNDMYVYGQAVLNINVEANEKYVKAVIYG